MNRWVKESTKLANTDCYLDLLFNIYPITGKEERIIKPEIWKEVERSFHGTDDADLIKSLLKLELFPIKDPYIRYMKKDRMSITRNPLTVKRLVKEIRSFDLDELRQRAVEPKESNRQLGPLFNNWVISGGLGVKTFDNIDEFINGIGNRCFVGSDTQRKEFVEKELGYNLKKGLDFLAIFNNKPVLGEAKLITDFGGHQQTQFDDAMSLLEIDLDVIKVAILDGVIYIENGNSKMQRAVRESNDYIMSALILKKFLESI